ncbi:hypothetical protein EV361DRAFT_1004434 [Lentinula raphanica]|nr:hypothetical protein EV361DRAFT_1004434 [Lentinula raphanica]
MSGVKNTSSMLSQCQEASERHTTHSFVFVKEKVVSAHLKLNDEQHEAIRLCYKEHHYDEVMFNANDSQQQQMALEKLISLELDHLSLAMLENKWSCQHSQTWGKGAAAAKKRTLYQCSCGHIARASENLQGREFSRSQSFGGIRAATSQRRVSYPFTECLAHAEITVRINDGKILKISGIFEHNLGCKQAADTVKLL